MREGEEEGREEVAGLLFMTMTTTATTAALAYNTWCGVDACLRGCSRNKPLASVSIAVFNAACFLSYMHPSSFTP